MELIIKYKDENDEIIETSLKDIIDEIGFDHGIPYNVIRLTSPKQIIEVVINNVVVWRAS